MSCQVSVFADCGDISSLGRALFIPEKEGKVSSKIVFLYYVSNDLFAFVYLRHKLAVSMHGVIVAMREPAGGGLPQSPVPAHFAVDPLD